MVDNKHETTATDTVMPVQNNNSILAAFKNEFSTSVIPVYINSTGRTVNFREVTVTEQKTLSKTMIQNDNRKDIIYDSQCALINKICVDKDFDIYNLTEFDRIRILMEIYSSNYFHEKIKFKCKECGCDNEYSFDFDKIVDRLNKFDLKDIKYTLEDRVRVYNFNLNYPTVDQVSRFYKKYMQNYKNASKKEQQVLDDLGNIDYVNLYIKSIEIINKTDSNKHTTADLRLMSYGDVEQLLSYFPQNIMFDEETGVLKYITKNLIETLNAQFQYEKCAQCGAENQGEGIGSIADFL